MLNPIFASMDWFQYSFLFFFFQLSYNGFSYSAVSYLLSLSAGNVNDRESANYA